MQALEYWKAVTADHSGFLDRLLAVLKDSGVKYCIIGGQAVNAYVEPVVSLDLDIAVVTTDLPSAEAALSREFRVERFAHSASTFPRPDRTFARNSKRTLDTRPSLSMPPPPKSWV
jgi:hypothetical protein